MNLSLNVIEGYLKVSVHQPQSTVQVQEPSCHKLDQLIIPSLQSQRTIAPIPPEHFLSSLTGLKAQKNALVSYSEVYEWYPELKGLAEYMLSFGSFENVKKALKIGEIGPERGRNVLVRINELKKIAPEQVKRLKQFFITDLVNVPNRRITMLLGVSWRWLRFSTKHRSLYNKIIKLEEKARLIKQRLKDEYPRSNYSKHFQVNQGLPFKYHADCGELLGYSKEDILVFGFMNCLPKGICKDLDDRRIEITDWDFVEQFYENAKRWQNLSS